MNHFRLNAHLLATTTDARVIHAAFTEFLHQHGFTPNPDAAPIVERTNILVGDTIWEIWVHQGEDGPGIIDICHSAEAAEYAVMSRQMSGTPLEKRTVHSRKVVVTQQWLDEYHEPNPEPELV